MNRQSPPIHLEKGQSLVEFAFGMIILILLLAGIVDAGRALFTYMSLREAAQEGALYASVYPTDTAKIIERVEHASDILEDIASESPSALTTQVTAIGTACSGNGIRVRVSYSNFRITMPFLGAVLGSQSVPISASVTDTILTPPCH